MRIETEGRQVEHRNGEWIREDLGALRQSDVGG